MAFASGNMNFTIAATSGDLVRQADGSYLTVWTDGTSVFGQAFNADGSHRGGQIVIATGETPRVDVSATLLSNGDTVVTWVESGSVMAQRLGDGRQLIGLAADLGFAQGRPHPDPQVYDLGEGNYKVLYHSLREGSDPGAPEQVVAAATVTENVIAIDYQAAQDSGRHAFAALTTGAFLILYNNGTSIRIEDRTSSNPVDKFVVRSGPDAPVNQAVAALAGGKFVIAWQDNTTVGGDSVIKAQVFDSNRDPVGEAVSFATPPGAVRSLSITELANGGFALLVQVANVSDYDVYVAACSADGTVIIPPLLVGSNAAGDQMNPEVVALTDGSFVISWLNAPNSTLMTEVFSGTPEGTNTPPTNIHLTTGGTVASVEENKTGGFVVATVSADDDGGAAGLRYSLTDDTFEIDAVTGQVKVKAGVVLDYERANNHTLSVKVKDQNGTGLSANQAITIKVTDLLESQQGTSKKDTLKGSIGADKLNGLSGNDVLTGGAGADIFVFNTALGKGTTSRNQNKKINFDTITDFTRGEDKIWLGKNIFKKLGKTGSEASPAPLNKKFFKTGKATDSNDYIIYKKGIVYYDADGAGSRYKPVEIIKIANKEKLSASDFFVV
ncbi:cadherin domain-containing protein [Microvirga sp. 2MCAF38]|uniref:cadherin repeat domain-containing protein n=1 Tax=Microvirga sp. 2MCAF38 TaxID=3232989 RepID=UPI003F9B13FF